MGQRNDLHKILVDILGSNNVYFQPPESIKMRYPCIIYERDGDAARSADNFPYFRTKRYTITVVDKDPDSKIPDKIADIPTAAFNRHFVADNLNHDSYSVYF